jgi:hypothetical protein
MTKEEALEFKRRWEVVNQFIIDEMKATPIEERFRRLAAMFGPSHGPDPDIDRVRSLWVELKEKTFVQP